ncbi:NAD(P)-binding protein [Sphingomonas sp. MAH-20]|uniref:NAD(P)-binding protein n=1 Tax=Sphingomonas horti TaxID=2682842 RepID=A0A6I4IYL2_9SPHN|nr:MULTISPECIES: FAD/NAD(P)-binding protein [Sphingomonas]MBA2918365.1 FAD/NAD(P)-binding protein [Sphingomonas sp. CGMCC 1.13658]MVO77332.1 NAD(P)-binding protein [Sphingomonas horti]
MFDQRAEVAIVGGGFSGTLLAINLLRHDGPRVTLIERREDQLARGVAYGSARPDHLLNVRAAGMSAFPDDPRHFERWLGRRSSGASPFVRRRLYGLYLRELLAETAAGAAHRLRVVRADVADLVEAEGRLRLDIAGAPPIEADAVVLATGSLPPAVPDRLGLDALDGDAFIADPWRPAGKPVPTNGRTLLIGTGLTAIDVLLDLDRQGMEGQVVAISRRGLLPRAHDLHQPAAAGAALPSATQLSRLTGRVRRRARDIGWRGAIDELRPVTHQLWWRADDATRRRFLRHLRPYWDVHRHRLAPEAMHRVRVLEREGRFQALAGRLLAIERSPDGLVVRWRPRGTDEPRAMTAGRIVNCSGVHGDLLRSGEALLEALARRGAIRPDPLRLGIETDAACRTVGAGGRVNRRLYCIGPMTRGAFWEMTAVPDLRRQAWMVARRLANAHWVGGEGL